MIPSPALLEKLSGSRFLVNFAKASVGTGERRSSADGAGLEFSKYRPYQEGDDVRHLDLRVRARFGENYIRQYSVDRQLPLTVILDGSASMAQGRPSKFEFAKTIAQAMGFIGLASGDRVEIGAFVGDRIIWSPQLQGTARSELLFDWVETQEPAGITSFQQALRSVASQISPGGLLILLSDWWTGDVAAELSLLAAARHEVLAIHVESPEEADPALLGQGLIRFVDAETAEEIELVLDKATIAEYARLHAEWIGTLQKQFARWHGRYFRISTATDPSDFFLRGLRGSGVIA